MRQQWTEKQAHQLNQLHQLLQDASALDRASGALARMTRLIETADELLASTTTEPSFWQFLRQDCVASRTSSQSEIEQQNKILRDELENIVRANYREWEPDLNNAESFAAWAKSRAAHALRESDKQ